MQKKDNYEKLFEKWFIMMHKILNIIWLDKITRNRKSQKLQYVKIKKYVICTVTVVKAC